MYTISLSFVFSVHPVKSLLYTSLRGDTGRCSSGSWIKSLNPVTRQHRTPFTCLSEKQPLVPGLVRPSRTREDPGTPIWLLVPPPEPMPIRTGALDQCTQPILLSSACPMSRTALRAQGHKVHRPPHIPEHTRSGHSEESNRGARLRASLSRTRHIKK